MLTKIEVKEREDSGAIAVTLSNGQLVRLDFSDKCDFITLTTSSGGIVILPKAIDQTKTDE